MKKLVIVESPAKIKTLSKYLGDDYLIEASIGHIRDLPKSNKQAIDIENGFKPFYVIIPGKEKVVNKLKKLSRQTAEVILATDPDREGEAIAWHVAQAVGLKNPTRITFHEITKEAVEEALKNPRSIDLNLKTAQEARRVLDRLFGYDLSGLIWKKVRYGLSAGRVQSPALRILVERERQIRAFKPEKYWLIEALTQTKNGEKLLLRNQEEFKEKKIVQEILKKAPALPWSVTDLKETEAQRQPRAPFRTSTLQQTASSRLGFSPARTMRIAQKLYEAGLITYMRTDSVNLSKQAQQQIAQLVKSKFGPEYYQPRVYGRQSKNAQEAHEAIRPTDFQRESAGANDEQKKLYDLIWRRAVSSQMAPAKIKRTKIIVQPDKQWPPFIAKGSRLLFPGWLKADPAAKGEETELPAVKIGDPLKLLEIKDIAKETTPPPRYSEAGLVKELEKRGIGRPSTYAPIIQTLKDRNYVVKEGAALRPTETGEVVSTFLEEHFPKYISDRFTADMEDDLDQIAAGQRGYVETLESFYQPFRQAIQEKENLPKLTTLGEADPKFKCPLCNEGMVIKLGRHGTFLSCRNFPDCKGARTIEGKVLAEPKELKEKCPRCGRPLVEREGRFGKFIACSGYPKCKFVKEDPEEAAKKKTGVQCPRCQQGEMVEKRGRFGVFYACSNYPQCKYAIKARPTGRICPECGSLMMEGTKTIPERCSNKQCPNHRPDRKK